MGFIGLCTGVAVILWFLADIFNELDQDYCLKRWQVSHISLCLPCSLLLTSLLLAGRSNGSWEKSHWGLRGWGVGKGDSRIRGIGFPLTNKHFYDHITILFSPYSSSPSQTALQTVWFSSSGAEASWWVGGSPSLLLSSPLWSQTTLAVAWHDRGYMSMNELPTNSTKSHSSAPTRTTKSPNVYHMDQNLI